MTLFKLIFEHDMLLESSGVGIDKKAPSSLDDFLKPTQTYSRFYLSATDLVEQRFGLSASSDEGKILSTFEAALVTKHVITSDGVRFGNVVDAIASGQIGDVFVISKSDRVPMPFSRVTDNDNFRDHITELKSVLDQGFQVLFLVKAHHGFDLHLYSKENIYRDFFYAFKPLINNAFRFFSINGKRAKSERLFYFETWSLHNPPHGFEEVFEDTAFY
jgi:hypothetical protein